jgi:hypothetical protein
MIALMCLSGTPTQVWTDEPKAAAWLLVADLVVPNGLTSLGNQKQDALNKVIILPSSCAGWEDDREKQGADAGRSPEQAPKTEPANCQATDSPNPQSEGGLQSTSLIKWSRYRK